MSFPSMGNAGGQTVIVEALRTTPVADRRIELVERKGIGHPDTICDSLVEAISVALNAMYLERLGAIPHYNIDKAMLVAGQCLKGFGWGEVKRPVELIVGDRATLAVNGARLPVEETASAAVDAWVGKHLPHLRAGKDLVTRSVLAAGSEELRSIFKGGGIASNDTAGASGYAPLSPTEELVLDVEGFLNSPEFKHRFPDTGQDVKVLAVRDGEKLGLTVAMPLLCLATASERAYFARKADLLDVLSRRFKAAPFELDWGLNCLDHEGAGTEGVYLTLTGTSAEDADSGQVGRGNRANGLIAFQRPTGGEAAPGKNPVAHVGKVYSVLSHRLARLIHARCPSIREVYVHLSARIGEPVDRPWTGIQVVLPAGMERADVEPAIRDVVEAEIVRMPELRAELIRGEHRVC
ncbi:MAG TPA: methionine adenosyltransferase [Candidatus Bathyarchaeia archaeon]|nr:methionine adenosyltransferase [Candidatus Bathyarchaeia archaeon]